MKIEIINKEDGIHKGDKDCKMIHIFLKPETKDEKEWIDENVPYIERWRDQNGNYNMIIDGRCTNVKIVDEK